MTFGCGRVVSELGARPQSTKTSATSVSIYAERTLSLARYLLVLLLVSEWLVLSAGDVDDTAIVAVAAVSLGYHDTSDPKASPMTWRTQDGH